MKAVQIDFIVFCSLYVYLHVHRNWSNLFLQLIFHVYFFPILAAKQLKCIKSIRIEFIVQTIEQIEAR